MSSTYEAVIVVGYTYSDLAHAYVKLVEYSDDEDNMCDFEDWIFNELIEASPSDFGGKWIQVVQPHYDAGWKSSLFGIVVEESGDYSYNQLLALEDFSMYINKMSEIFSISPKVYLSVNWS